MRHALTKLSHLHFPSNEESRQRIIAMGEEPARVHTVGDNHIDEIVAGQYTQADDLRTRFEIPDAESPILVLKHPETTRIRDEYEDMKNQLKQEQ